MLYVSTEAFYNWLKPYLRKLEQDELHSCAEMLAFLKKEDVAGKAVKLENVTDKQGFHATMYIKFNPETGRPYRYATNPDNAQQVDPSNESRTQVAVNNEGKTNEATKNLQEPLQKGRCV